ncbi:hypothetical protein F4808DRAFT_409257 [Astrocystis sublimbata]|nr:hypothetical protein F4808DRAFT_409257 [Astrocystis sublimbata]
MLHLRFHRRTPSNPTSPVLDRASCDTAALQPAHLVPADGVPAPDVRPRPDTSLASAHHAHGQPPARSQTQAQPHARRDDNPPVLPPIARVVSADSAQSVYGQDAYLDSDQTPRDDPKPLPQPQPRPPTREQPGFIGGLALENYSRGNEATHAALPGSSPLPPAAASGRQPVPAKAPRAMSSFTGPANSQSTPPLGKRPPGARMASDPPATSNPPVAREPSKAKKGLPFLKNPMSTLLLRRKTSQSIPDLSLPLRKRPEEPAYDPRIRGTVVHDFSAPRPRRPTPQQGAVGSHESATGRTSGDGHLQHGSPSAPTRAPPVPPKDDHVDSVRTAHRLSTRHSTDPSPAQGSRSLPERQSAGAQADEQVVAAAMRKSTAASFRSSVSRKASAASTTNTISAIPKHMKSTSSRFSFDMIASAEQEKILEERHRQRQQDKFSGLPSDRRDSRFDEFDEDSFDYDAMDCDDDLEERIPGVNADLDDYEEDAFGAADDPDNDQDNFAGFVFQRSDPTSLITSPFSPGPIPTPRDADGHVIGYAETGDVSGLEPSPQPYSSRVAEPDPSVNHHNEITTGLGIQGLGQAAESPEAMAERLHINDKRHLNEDDELYFNGGMHNFEGEGDGSAFDESIFDLNDTDQYGRPIPGMFPQALAQRNAAVEAKKRDSGMTSRLSGQSVVSQSTAHTSLSVDMRSKSGYTQHDDADYSHVLQQHQAPQLLPGQEDAGYLAALPSPEALVSHLHMAAASGKFRRDSSPDPPTDLIVTSPTASGPSHPDPDTTDEDPLAGYEDDDFSAGLDEYEEDDDPIIAEANASALANDYDGFYEQEFGFYSNPLPPSRHPSQKSAGENIYQYSNGGYFAPSGVARTTSGRVVSREPSLTPITERSEYSNRNSMMSIGWSPAPTNSGAIQSPGLAQLAMMAEDHDMSLHALMMLRNRAWGGSQASVSSSRDGSPYERNGAISPLNQETNTTDRKNSAFSLYSQGSTCADSDAGSPTLTAIPNLTTNPIPPLAIPTGLAASPVSAPVFSPMLGTTTFSPLSEVEEPASPESTHKIAQGPDEPTTPTLGVSPHQQRPSMGHRHKGSAGSISYVKEQDGNESRWILERRRTGERGETEVLEREVVGGGRI